MTWLMFLLVIAVVIFAGRGIQNFFGPTGRVSRRGVRVTGLALVVLSVAAIIGGQAYDLAQLDAIEGDPEIELLTGVANDPLAAKRFHVRFMLFSQPELDRSTVDAFAVGEVTVGGGDVEFTPTWTGAETRDLRFTARVDAPLPGGRIGVSHGYEHENGSASSSTSVGPDEGYQYFDIGTMYVERRRSFFRTFDGRRLHLVYAVVMQPMDEGTVVERAKYSSVWTAGEGDRVRTEFKRYQFDGTAMKAGVSAVMSRVSGFAFVSLIVGIFGAAMSLRLSGFGVALWIAVAPLVLIYADRMAIDAFERAIAEDDRPAVRAAALRGLDDTVFFVRTARERIAARRSDEDPGIARLARQISRMQPSFHQDIERIDVGPEALGRAMN